LNAEIAERAEVAAKNQYAEGAEGAEERGARQRILNAKVAKSAKGGGKPRRKAESSPRRRKGTKKERFHHGEHGGH
jgi:hypothetical protein